ncbi:MAG: argininosuccinate lyase [Actinobacteria bacterium]|nr:argininosuccinate lyase [Actinomycetota bacterium]MCG2808060.1 argininosuccinate lyase [Coriobacteriia bacterium]
MAEAKKPWGGRFEASPSEFLDAYGASLPVDKRMWAEDIKGSIAHARMLAKQGVITATDADAIEAGLSEIFREIRDGEFEFRIADEDIHMAIERTLTERIGQAGGRLHTARSRNDQVALDARLYAKTQAAALARATLAMRTTIIDLARQHLGHVMPGYTHMQKAQPVLFSHHLLAYYWMLSRDTTRMRHAYEAADSMPLGSAALAGTTFPIDRQYVADRLGFSEVSANSMDSVSDRDFLLDLGYACTVTMVHLSRLCEELILWSTEEFGFITMDDTYSTGSSIMPQKKNPDFAELTRGKTGRVVGDLVGLLTVLKGLPLAYNKDMQEDKEGVFDAIDTTLDALVVCDGMLSSMRVNTGRMLAGARGGFMAATDLADYLVGTGMPFRDAHEVVGRLVLECEKTNRTLQELSAEEFGQVDAAFGPDALGAVDIQNVVAKRVSEGGTGADAVMVQLDRAASTLDADSAWVESLRD